MFGNGQNFGSARIGLGGSSHIEIENDKIYELSEDGQFLKAS